MSSTISRKNISKARGLILIKFDVKHHYARGLIALGFGADCIKIVVSMVTDSSHRLSKMFVDFVNKIKSTDAILLK